MKAAKWIVGFTILALLLTVLPANASAESRAIPAGRSFTRNVTVDTGQFMPYSWSSNEGLYFTVTDPDGIVITSVNNTFHVGVLTASTSGTYSFTWQNLGTSSANLNYDLNFLGHGISSLILGALIGVIVIIVIIIVIVVVVMSAGRTKTQPAQLYAAVGPPMAVVGGNCPMCGSPVDPQGTFCARCGAKLR